MLVFTLVHIVVLKLFADYRSPSGRGMSRFSVVYGPFYSRRRGFSLGVNPFPGVNVCSFDCIYCFRGGPNNKTLAPMRGSHDVTVELLRRALSEAFSVLGDEVYRLEAVDFSGNGEPTLHPRFSELVVEARRLLEEYGVKASLGVITNSTRLCSPSVRDALAVLDHIEAKLDSVVGWKFIRVNRPEPATRLIDVLSCLRVVRGYTPARIAIQVLLLEEDGFRNYELLDAEAMAAELAQIEPDIVHLYTSYAPPKTRTVKKAPSRAMERFASVLRSHGLKVRVFPE